MTRTLIAGFGSVLHGDDGFGVEVVHRLEAIASTIAMPAGVEIIDVGTGGIHLVQRLLDGFDVLLVADAVCRDGPPGTLYLLEATVPEPGVWSDAERRDLLADMHYAEPSRALILAKALGVLPATIYILGCEPEARTDLRIGLSAPVTEAVDTAIAEIRRLLRQWSHPPAATGALTADG